MKGTNIAIAVLAVLALAVIAAAVYAARKDKSAAPATPAPAPNKSIPLTEGHGNYTVNTSSSPGQNSWLSVLQPRTAAATDPGLNMAAAGSTGSSSTGNTIPKVQINRPPSGTAFAE